MNSYLPLPPLYTFEKLGLFLSFFSLFFLSENTLLIHAHIAFIHSHFLFSTRSPVLPFSANSGYIEIKYVAGHIDKIITRDKQVGKKRKKEKL